MTEDRLFVPLKTEHYHAFGSGEKDVELRGLNDQFNHDTVYPGRRAELRRGYSTSDSLWGTIEHVWGYGDIAIVAREMDHERILPGASREEFIESARGLVGDYNHYIAFSVNLERVGSRECLHCGYVSMGNEINREEPPGTCPECGSPMGDREEVR